MRIQVIIARPIVSIVLFMTFYLNCGDLFAQQLAFPGAEGFGRFATGGRNGSVYHVTNLNDSGDGSFRDAVSESYRTVIFDVGGVINIDERIVIQHDITVAGQTAPGGGITIYGNGIAFNDDSGNSIIRYIRIRMGKNGDSGKDAVGISAGQNYMFDHVSISWGRDGTLDVNGSGIDNLTFQDCIIGQGINNTNHSTGGLMQSGRWSVIRSLYIDNKTRNPKARGTHEFINSVLYNWAEHGYIMGDTEGLSECNLIGNYFIYGPSSNSGSHITNTTNSFHVYPEDNWVDADKDGILDGSLLTDYKTATLESTPYAYPGVNNQLSAQDALSYVIQNVGASIVRDEVDDLLISELLSYGTEGQIINTEDDNGIPGNVGTVNGGTAPADNDGDGMPDSWETANGFDPNSADNNGDADGDGYTNLEEYLNALVDGGSGETSGLTIQENATGFCGIDGTVDSNNSGYTGSGFANTDNTSGNGVDWRIDVGTGGTYTFAWRYANGSSTNRTAQLMVNGTTVVSDIGFNSTGSWTSWNTVSTSASLGSGMLEVRLQATNGEGLANIDYITITGADASATSCSR